MHMVSLLCFVGSKSDLIDVFKQWLLLTRNHEHVDHFLVTKRKNKLTVKMLHNKRN